MKGNAVAQLTDNPVLAKILPPAPQGHFWKVKDDDPKAPRSKPLRLNLHQAIRDGVDMGHTIGWEYCEANDESLIQTAKLILVRSADRKKYVGVAGVSDT